MSAVPYPFEVIPADGGGFTWRMIAGCGRTLAYTSERYPTDFAAAEAAKSQRALMADRAESVDG